jgi:hypothetical protein
MPPGNWFHARPFWLSARVRVNARLFVVLAVCVTVPFGLRQPADWFEVYVPAAARLWTGGPLYPNPFRFVYPPLAAFLAGSFLNLPPLAGRALWLGLNAVALMVLWFGAWRLADTPMDAPAATAEKEPLIALLGLACGIPFALDALSNQQPDLILGALIIGGCLLLEHGRALSAATLFGLAAAVKCTPLLWGPYLAWRRRWGAAGLVFVAAVGFSLLPDLVIPPMHTRPRLVEWASHHIPMLARKDVDVGSWANDISYNHSLAGLAHRLVLLSPVWDGSGLRFSARATRPSAVVLKGAVYSLGLALVLLAALASRQGRCCSAARSSERGGGSFTVLEYALVCLLMLILSPMSSKPHFCTLVLPGFCLARRMFQRRELTLQLITGAALLAALVSNMDLVGKHTYTVVVWSGSVFASAALLYSGCCWSLWRLPVTTEDASVNSRADVRMPLVA